MAAADLSFIEKSTSAYVDDEQDQAFLAAERGREKLATWTRDGTLLDGEEFALAYGINPTALDAARARADVFSLWVEGEYWYPAEAIKLGVAAMALINHRLGDIDPSSKLLFLLRQHGALRGLTVSEAVVHGQLDDVLRLADDWAHT